MEATSYSRSQMENRKSGRLLSKAVHRSFPFRRPIPSKNSSQSSIQSTTSKTAEKVTRFHVFVDILSEILQTLHERRYCSVVKNIMKQSNTSFTLVNNMIISGGNGLQSRHEHINGETKNTANHSTKTKCKKLHHRKSDTSSTSKTTLLKAFQRQMARLYNSLTLPFQCHVLYRTSTVRLRNYKSKNRFPMPPRREKGTRQARVSRNQKRISRSTSKRLVFTHPSPVGSSNSLLDSKHAFTLLGGLLQSTETEVRREFYGVIPVSKQCNKALVGLPSYMDTVRVAVPTKNESVVRWIKEKLRIALPTVMHAFKDENRLKLPSSDNPAIPGQRTTFYVEFVKMDSNKLKSLLYIHIHLNKKKSRALSANFVLSAIFNYGTTRLNQLIGFPLIRFRATPKTVDALMQGNETYQKPRKLFLPYLISYFNNLHVKQKCFIMKIIASHSNIPLKVVIKKLYAIRRFKPTLCLPRSKKENGGGSDNVVNSNYKPPKNVDRKPPEPPVGRTVPKIHKKVKAVTKATVVELFMLVILAILAVLIILFFSACSLFIYRKKKIDRRKNVLALNQSTKGQPSTDQSRRGTPSDECTQYYERGGILYRSHVSQDEPQLEISPHSDTQTKIVPDMTTLHTPQQHHALSTGSTSTFRAPFSRQNTDNDLCGSLKSSYHTCLFERRSSLVSFYPSLPHRRCSSHNSGRSMDLTTKILHWREHSESFDTLRSQSPTVTNTSRRNSNLEMPNGRSPFEQLRNSVDLRYDKFIAESYCSPDFVSSSGGTIQPTAWSIYTPNPTSCDTICEHCPNVHISSGHNTCKCSRIRTNFVPSTEKYSPDTITVTPVVRGRRKSTGDIKVKQSFNRSERDHTKYITSTIEGSNSSAKSKSISMETKL